MTNRGTENCGVFAFSTTECSRKVWATWGKKLNFLWTAMRWSPIALHGGSELQTMTLAEAAASASSG